MLYKEYDTIASMRLKYLASQRRRAEQFTVGQITILFSKRIFSSVFFFVFYVMPTIVVIIFGTHEKFVMKSHLFNLPLLAEKDEAYLTKNPFQQFILCSIFYSRQSHLE